MFYVVLQQLTDECDDELWLTSDPLQSLLLSEPSPHRLEANKALMCRNLVKQTFVETKDLISALAHDSIKSLCFDAHICSAPLPLLMCSIFANNAASLYRITISVLVKLGTMLPLAFNYHTVQQAQCIFFSALQQGHKK